MHDLSLISTIASAFTAAWVLGIATQWLGLSPIVGYLLAGVLIGPHTPGFAGDVHVAQQLAEVGVILLMFGVGLHFHLKDLLAVKNIAIPGAIGQSVVATAFAMVIFASFGLPMKSGAVLGMAMAVASTVVLMRVLMDAAMLETPQGHVAVGWLIVEDVFTVVLLVLIPVLGGGNVEETASAPLWQTLGLALVKLVALVGIVFLAGSRAIPWALVRVARLRSRELFTLTVLVFSIAIAAGSYFFFGASMALGAFLAGMVVAQSPVSHQAAADALPMRDAFAVLFFVSVGMLFDPKFLVQEPLMITAALGVIMFVKPLAALAIVAILGHSARTGLVVAIGLAQIGEFSFILSDLARQHGLMEELGHNALVAAAIISITINPLLFRSLPKIESWTRQHPILWRLLDGRAQKHGAAENLVTAVGLERASDETSRRAIVVGFGPVGRSVHRLLKDAQIATVVIDLNMDTVSALRKAGQAAIFGDAAQETILEQAGAARASHLVLTLPHSTDRAAVVATARALNPNLRILVRARYLREREDLEHAGANAAVFEEAEAAVALARLVLSDTGLYRGVTDTRIMDIRLQLITENISNIRSQRVRSVMVPWSRVRWLPSTANKEAIFELVSRERFSRWPVFNPTIGQIMGYLLTKDLIARAGEGDWTRLVRPLRSISPIETIESVLSSMQSEGASIYAVTDERGPVGLITREDILEQVVGRIEDEYPHDATAGALTRQLTVVNLMGADREAVVGELVDAAPAARLPVSISRKEIVELALEREKLVSTDLGNGVAVPHARLPGLRAPIVILGRSVDGVSFRAGSAELVHLAFLLITPTEQPETQLALLGEVAHACRDDATRERLLKAESPAAVVAILSEEARGRNQG